MLQYTFWILSSLFMINNLYSRTSPGTESMNEFRDSITVFKICFPILKKTRSELTTCKNDEGMISQNHDDYLMTSDNFKWIFGNIMVDGPQAINRDILAMI